MIQTFHITTLKNLSHIANRALTIMTPKSLFNIILKIFGLYLLKEIVFVIPQAISSIYFLLNASNLVEEGFKTAEVLVWLLVLILVFLYGFLIYLLLFKTNKIIDILKLTQGFDQQKFSFNLSSSYLLTISLIIFSGILLLNEIPDFIRNVFSYLQERNLTRGVAKPDFSFILISGVKIIIALLIIGERKWIVEFIDRRQTRKEEDEDQEIA